MAEYAILSDGKVANIVVAEAAIALENGWIDATGARIGDTWDGTSFVSPPVDLDAWRAGAAVSRTEFCLALKRADILPASEAVAAAQGNWPATFQAVLTNTPEIDADEAQIIWAGAVDISRNHPLIAPLQVAASLTDAQVDALFGFSA